jgi:hypothetical protein
MAQAQGTVHQSQCLTPRNRPDAPVGVIYLHGWFPHNQNSGHSVNSERANRQQLQELADQLGVSIAVPVSTQVHSNGNRSWSPSQTPGSAAARLQQIEAQSRAACGGRSLLAPRSLIGFSNGGYMAREIALQCAARRSDYNAIVMIGARARVAGGSFRDCANFLAVRGTSDGSTDSPDAPFSRQASRMMEGFSRGGGEGRVLDPYDGGHVFPPNAFFLRNLPQFAGQDQPGAAPASSPPSPRKNSTR